MAPTDVLEGDGLGAGWQLGDDGLDLGEDRSEIVVIDRAWIDGVLS